MFFDIFYSKNNYQESSAQNSLKAARAKSAQGKANRTQTSTPFKEPTSKQVKLGREC